MATKKKNSKTTKSSSTSKINKTTAGKKKATGKRAATDENVGPPIEPSTDSVGEISAVDGMVFTWEDDPMANPVRHPIQVPEPTLPAGTLGITIVEPAPPAQLHPVGTSKFRYWAAAEALTRGMKFWQRFLPAGTRWSTPDGKLRVNLDLDVDLNAYYRRGMSRLEFYHSTVGGRTVYSGESPNIVCHELGHAVLDAIRPQLFNVASIEAAAFHESFGDISAILSALQLDSTVQEIINETGGRLNRSTFLSRMAEELGWAIRQINPQAVEPDCLRNAVNSFFYRDPTTLPTSAPAAVLSSAPHSFSRIFTGAFYDALAGMVTTDNATPTVQSIQKVSRDAGQLLIDAIGKAPVVPNYFSQVAAQVIAADAARFRKKYRDVLKGAFVRHGVLSLEASATITSAPTPITAAAGIFDASKGGSYASQTKEDLIFVPVPATDLGFSAESILCAAPGEIGGFPMAAASALDTGSLPASSHKNAVMSFVADLLRLGRIDIGGHGDADSQTAQPTVRKTHTLVATKDGSPMLVRDTFDCGFD
ncbi:MAG: hypothetical protein M3033_17740 [Acidobacteriota bacterium]|nr:hypothetical protein [Acidobacteriota bacterium]